MGEGREVVEMEGDEEMEEEEEVVEAEEEEEDGIGPAARGDLPGAAPATGLWRGPPKDPGPGPEVDKCLPSKYFKSEL